MKKFLWNLAGVVLFLANILALIFCICTASKIWAVVMICLAGVDWLYKENLPVWLEV